MSPLSDGNSAGRPLLLFALTAAAIAAAWWWLGAPVPMPPSPLAPGEKLYCVSYAPFRDSQSPMVEGTRVPAAQIDEDMALLSKFTDCVRTYSSDDVGEDVLISARRYGLKVLYGIWVTNRHEMMRRQIATTIDLAKKYTDVIRGIVVGNEVMLRGEMSVTDLEAVIREVKSQVSEPVTYADVWEFWLRFADIQNFVDFVTIHILPYWEDFPIPASQAGAHVESIRKLVATAIPNKEILIGETGWPSQGRMREGALPSPSNQARAIQDTLAVAKRDNFRVNVIEAFDQPWKRRLEGSTGRYWGIFDRGSDGPKFVLGGAVSDHPHWPLQALAGIALAALTFGAAAFAGGKMAVPQLWPCVAGFGFVSSVLFGWTLERVPIESYTAGGWLRSFALAAIASAAPVVCAAACASGRTLPPFTFLLGREGRPRDRLGIALGCVFIVLTLLSVQEALGIVFDPRYRDLVFAPLGGAAVPFLVLMFAVPRASGRRAAAESLAAAVLAASVIYIVPNESFANWQAVLFCAALLFVAVTLVRVRDAPDSR